MHLNCFSCSTIKGELIKRPATLFRVLFVKDSFYFPMTQKCYHSTSYLGIFFHPTCTVVFAYRDKKGFRNINTLWSYKKKRMKSWWNATSAPSSSNKCLAGTTNYALIMPSRSDSYNTPFSLFSTAPNDVLIIAVFIHSAWYITVLKPYIS